MSDTPSQSSRNAKLVRLATYASTTTAILLIVVKAWAWHLSGSIALLSSLVDSLIDAFASLLTLFAIHHAQAPADKEHRFGHGKAEALAALAQAAFITASALLLMLHAVERLYNPTPLAATEIGISIMGVSIIATLLLIAFQRYVIAKSNSVAIKADSMHYVTDLLTNVAVIVALILTGTMGWIYADPIIGCLIALYILKSAWDIGREALDMLMDTELSDEVREEVRAIVFSHEQVLGIHDLRTRQSGSKYFIQLHMELPDDLSLVEAHHIADAVEFEVMQSFDDAEVIVHQDPVSRADKPATDYHPNIETRHKH